MKDRTLLSGEEGLMNSQRKSDFHGRMQKTPGCRAAAVPAMRRFLSPLHAPLHISLSHLSLSKPWMSF